MFHRSGGQIRNPLTPLQQNVIELVWLTGRLPSEILAEEDKWIELLLLDMDARARARRR